MRSRPSLFRTLALVGLLLAAGSCAPVGPTPGTAAEARAQAPVRGRALLRRLALDVPTDLADDPVPTAAPVPAAAPPFVAQAATTDDALRAEDCLTAAVYYEARSESEDGQRAVAQVVLNRVRDRAFPASVCGVVYQGSNRATGCQFSFTCDGSMNRPREPNAWARARSVAVAALAGAVYAPVGTATHYHALSVLPWWASSLARVGAIGSHLFYRWGGRLERALTFRQGYAGTEPTPGASPTLPAEAQVAGVRVFRGAELAFGVAIHRGRGATDPEPATDASGVTLQVADQVAQRTPRLRTVAGVRVHRGVPAPDVAEESDPI